MFAALLRPARRKISSPKPRRAQLSVECLGERLVPTTPTAPTYYGGSYYDGSSGPSATVNQAPIIELAYSIYNHSQHTVILTGRVTDEYPGNLTVTFAGQVNASTLTNSDGTFQWIGSAAALGEVTATTVDTGGLNSNVAQVTITTPPPVITALDAHPETQGYWMITGRVQDTNLAGRTVTFSGLESVATKTAVVQPDGTFTLSWTLGAGESGWVTARVTDWWGQADDECVMVNPV